MVKTIEEKGKKLFMCEACFNVYDTKKLATDCEGWCKSHWT